MGGIDINSHRILALWAHPRSLSTALERVFIERGDFLVMHEPFSVVYYVHERRAAAAHADFDPDEVADYASVRAKILQAATQKPVCFKDMCYHCDGHLLDDETFLRRLTHVFLIRDPRQAIASHYAKNPQVTSEEIGYEKQANVFRKVARLTGTPPGVISAEYLQQDPAGMVSALCHKVGLDDRPEAMTWQAGARNEWHNWAPWHHEVAHSTRIQSRQTNYADTVDNHPGLAAFFRYHRPFYEEMRRHRLLPRNAL